MPASLTGTYICSCRWHRQEKAALSKVASTNSPYPALPGAKPAVLCALNPPGCVCGGPCRGLLSHRQHSPYGLATHTEGQVSAKDTQLESLCPPARPARMPALRRHSPGSGPPRAQPLLRPPGQAG